MRGGRSRTRSSTRARRAAGGLLPHDLPLKRATYCHHAACWDGGADQVNHEILRCEAGIVLPSQVRGHADGTVRKALVDQGSKKQTVVRVADMGIEVEVEVVERSPQDRGFVPQPKRWRVAQAFGILIPHRRLVRDYE